MISLTLTPVYDTIPPENVASYSWHIDEHFSGGAMTCNSTSRFRLHVMDSEGEHDRLIIFPPGSFSMMLAFRGAWIEGQRSDDKRFTTFTISAMPAGKTT